LFFFP
jgi:hypothetical protein